jgi:FKBP-type peptidyl-prolyl cis-trans isomerase FkpA
MTKLLIALSAFTVFISCTKTTYTPPGVCSYTETTATANAAEIAVVQAFASTYSAANPGYGPILKDSSGLFYQVGLPGTGTVTPVPCSAVTVKYTGRLFSGAIFEQQLFGTSFLLGEVIAGWQKGIPKIKKGGTIRMFIPASLAYGASGSGTSIPPNANLIFEIELVNVQ